MVIKVTEREVSGWLSEEINKIISQGGSHFLESSVEALAQDSGKTNYPDIVIWNNRQTNDAFAFIELKQPGKKENIKKLPGKATACGVKYCLTWDFVNATFYEFKGDKTIARGSFDAFVMTDVEEWKREDIRIKLRSRLDDILEHFRGLKEKGILFRFPPDKVYFIKILRECVESLNGILVDEITKLTTNNKFKNELVVWSRKQSIKATLDRDFFETIGYHKSYSIVTKLLFFLTLRRYNDSLPDLLNIKLTSKDINNSLEKAFSKAKEIDWHAVFEENFLDKIQLPDSASKEILNLLRRLKNFNFGNLKEDVIGEIFEQLIPHERRHRLGQYFTREDLVDFIIAFVADEKDGVYCDPTCGSGTFLNRLYSRVKYLSAHKKPHNKLLSQLWGVDISQFPAQLATINLFKQRIDKYENFPRVLCDDFFNIYLGKKCEFPPPTLKQGGIKKINVEIPNFTGMVGNFPFIRQELIEKVQKGYKSSISKVVAKHWFWEYPDMFNTDASKSEIDKAKKGVAKDKNAYIENNIDNGKMEIKLSGQADIYTYMFLHAGSFLKNEARMGFITSNSWLDVAYGNELKKYLLNNYKIIAIVGSWVEPWFEDASINTVFTILERCDNAKERNNHKVRFVKLKKTLKELIKYDDLNLDESNRWRHIDKLTTSILLADEKVKGANYNKYGDIGCYEDDNFRIRVIKQGHFLKKKDFMVSIDKWGKYLRAPDVYFDILDKCRDKFVPLGQIVDIRRGYTTGINDFFYLKPTGEKPSNKTMTVVSTKKWQGEIETEFLKPVIKSPKEAKGIVIDPKDLKFKLFICNYSKAELKKRRKLGALKYIEWGEKQKTSSDVKWSQVPSVSSRKHWWSIEIVEQPDFLINRFVDKRYYVPKLPQNVNTADTFFVGYDQNKLGTKLNAFLNSSLYSLFVECNGRVNLGDGLLTYYGPDIDSSPILSKKIIRSFTPNIVKNIEEVSKRAVFQFNIEVNKKDRNKLDLLLLDRLGLDSKKYLPKIYQGISEMVSERITLPKLRKKQKKQKETVSTDSIKKAIEEEFLREELKRFPDAFVSKQIKDKTRKVSTTGKILKIGNHFFGKYEILDDDDIKIMDADSKDEAKFAIYSYEPDNFLIKIPKDAKLVTKAVIKYEKYLSEFKEKVFQRAMAGTGDYSQAERIMIELFQDYNIPIIL